MRTYAWIKQCWLVCGCLYQGTNAQSAAVWVCLKADLHKCLWKCCCCCRLLFSWWKYSFWVLTEFIVLSCILRTTPWPAAQNRLLIVWGPSARKLEMKMRDYRNSINLWDWSTDSAPVSTFTQRLIITWGQFIRLKLSWIILNGRKGMQLINRMTQGNLAQPALSEQHVGS